MLKTVTPWRPFRALTPFRPEPSDLFERFFEGLKWPGMEWEEEWATVPRVETHVEGNVLTVKVDLPGIDPKEVELTVEGKRLTLKAERKAEKHAEGTTYHHEVRYGAFERTLELPAEVETEKVEAHYANGVLEVTVPLPAEVLPKKVPIEVQAEEPKKLAA